MQIFVANQFVANLLGAAGSPILLCILGSHLLINLKEAGELGVNKGTNYRSRTISDVEFADGLSSFSFLSSTKKMIQMTRNPYLVIHSCGKSGMP